MRNLFLNKTTWLLMFFVLLASAPVISKHKIAYAISLAEEHSIYEDLHLEELGLKATAFDQALKGWNNLKIRSMVKSNVLSIVDLSQSSNSKRLYVIDMLQKKLLFNTYVAHGRNSGQEFATSFSNTSNSFKSSLGFYLTGATYEGTHGLSMRLLGMEKGINDIAEQRGIVMHGAPYVSETFIRQNGRLGRSQGCPSVAEDLCAPIINSIKNGSCFFMYHPDPNYLNLSNIL